MLPCVGTEINECAPEEPPLGDQVSKNPPLKVGSLTIRDEANSSKFMVILVVSFSSNSFFVQVPPSCSFSLSDWTI